MTQPRLILGHKGQLQEVLINLIHNAIEAMDPINDRPRILRLTTDNYDRHAVTIKVEDTGPGVRPIKARVIFDAFVTTKPQGTGLGLAICRMIIERHGGQLFAAPSDKGGVFQLILPVDSSAEAPKVRPALTQIADRDALLHAK
jgi:signal transduction histidine kinase